MANFKCLPIPSTFELPLRELPFVMLQRTLVVYAGTKVDEKQTQG